MSVAMVFRVSASRISRATNNSMALAKEITPTTARTRSTKNLSTTTPIETMELLPTRILRLLHRKTKLESMINQVLEGRQKMTVDFNGKLDVVYTNWNIKFEALKNHVKKLETQVIQINDAVRR